MNSKNLIAAVLGGLTAFIGGWLLFGVLLSSTMEGMAGTASGVMKSDEEMMAISNMLIILVGNLVTAYLLTHIFTKWAGISSAASGASAGALLTGIFALGYNLVMLGTTNITTFSGVLVDVIGSAAIWGLGGAVIGWWLGRGKS